MERARIDLDCICTSENAHNEWPNCTYLCEHDGLHSIPFGTSVDTDSHFY